MDDQQARVNEVAQRFADALQDSFRTVSERTVSAQELNAELTQSFFNSVIDNLRTQAESNREMAQQLADQQQRQQEATQALAQESVNAYMDFVNSMFSFYQGGVQQAQRQTEQAQSSSAGEAGGGSREELGNIVRESVQRSRGEV